MYSLFYWFIHLFCISSLLCLYIVLFLYWYTWWSLHVCVIYNDMLLLSERPGLMCSKPPQQKLKAEISGRHLTPWPVPWASFRWCCWRWAPGCWAAWRAKVVSSWTLPLLAGARWPCVVSRMTSMPGRRLWAQKIRPCCWSRPRT